MGCSWAAAFRRSLQRPGAYRVTTRTACLSLHKILDVGVGLPTLALPPLANRRHVLRFAAAGLWLCYGERQSCNRIKSFDRAWPGPTMDQRAATRADLITERSEAQIWSLTAKLNQWTQIADDQSHQTPDSNSGDQGRSKKWCQFFSSSPL